MLHFFFLQLYYSLWS